MKLLVLVLLGFACPLAGALLGAALRRCLPEHHLAKDSADAIRLAAGIVATLIALVLSLLVSSANSQRGNIVAEQQQALAGVLQLDDYLAAYGPETADARAMLRSLLRELANLRWPGEGFAEDAGPPQGSVVELGRRIALLKPADAAQQWLQAGALEAMTQIMAVKHMVSGQRAGTAPLVPVFVLVFVCSFAVFASFGLLSDPNPTLVVALALSALALAGATFLIIELNDPFDGVMRISSATAWATIDTLGR